MTSKTYLLLRYSYLIANANTVHTVLTYSLIKYNTWKVFLSTMNSTNYAVFIHLCSEVKRTINSIRLPTDLLLASRRPPLIVSCEHLPGTLPVNEIRSLNQSASISVPKITNNLSSYTNAPLSRGSWPALVSRERWASARVRDSRPVSDAPPAQPAAPLVRRSLPDCAPPSTPKTEANLTLQVPRSTFRIRKSHDHLIRHKLSDY